VSRVELAGNLANLIAEMDDSWSRGTHILEARVEEESGRCGPGVTQAPQTR
jgi:hypothetical protein